MARITDITALISGGTTGARRTTEPFGNAGCFNLRLIDGFDFAKAPRDCAFTNKGKQMTVFACANCEGGTVDTAKNNNCGQCGEDASTVVIKPNLPTYKFRRPARCTGYGFGAKGLRHYGVRRYAGGRWIPDDGQPDLAFIGFSPYNDGRGGAPIFFYVKIHELQKSTAAETISMFGRSWQVTRGEPHPNWAAEKSACAMCCEIGGCASGYTVTPDQCV